MSNKDDFFRMDFRFGKNKVEERLVSDKQKLIRYVSMSGEIGEESDPTIILITLNGPKSNVDQIMEQIGLGSVGDICTSKFKTILKQDSLFDFIDKDKEAKEKRKAKKKPAQTSLADDFDDDEDNDDDDDDFDDDEDEEDDEGEDINDESPPKKTKGRPKKDS